MTPSPAALVPASSHLIAPGVYAYDLESLPWRDTPRGTVREKAVRREAETGRFLGMLTFEPQSRSGVHQHLATATSYFLAGSLVDYQGTTREGAVGINLAGATHDAVTYTGCTLVARLEGPVIIPDDELAIHPHAAAAVLRNARPGTPPDISIYLEQTLPSPRASPASSRRPLFDYAGTGTDRRLSGLVLWPRTAHAASAAHRADRLLRHRGRPAHRQPRRQRAGLRHRRAGRALRARAATTAARCWRGPKGPDWSESDAEARALRLPLSAGRASAVIARALPDSFFSRRRNVASSLGLSGS